MKILRKIESLRLADDKSSLIVSTGCYRKAKKESERCEKRRERGEKTVLATWRCRCRHGDGDSDDGPMREIYQIEKKRRERGNSSETRLLAAIAKRRERPEMEVGEEGEGARDRESSGKRAIEIERV